MKYNFQKFSFHLFIFLDITGPPEKCAITNTTAHTLTVECIPGYNGGLDQIFHLEVYINSSFEKRFVNNLTSSEYPFFIANSLPSGNTFYLVTYASNLKGKSSKVVITGNTLIAEKWKLGKIIFIFKVLK